MDKPLLDTLVPQRRGVGRWPVTLTTERANPLRRWNPGWGRCSTARRPVAAVNKLFLRGPVFVKRFTHEMTLQEVPGSDGADAQERDEGSGAAVLAMLVTAVSPRSRAGRVTTCAA